MVRNITGAILSCLFFVFIQANAQNSVGIGTPTPNPKAVLELVSPGNNQGLLVPRLTTSQRTSATFTSSLTAKENGLLVFDSDDQKFYYWQTSQWLPIRSGSDSSLTPGTGVTITNGTIAAVPDGDGSSTNELQELELTGNTLKITGSPTSATIDLSALTLADNSATNEIQDLKLVGSTLTITNNASATPINLSAFTGTDTDEQSLSYNATNGQLSITKLSGAPQTITITTAGTAGGDLTGSYPNPTIGTGKVTSTAILDNTIVNADILNVDASKITTGTLPVTRGGSGITAVTPGAVAYGGATNFAFTTAGTAGQILQSNGAAAPTWTTLTSLPPNGTAGGDLTGSYPNPTIGTGKVTSTAILDNTIVNADILNVDASKITTGTLPVARGGSGITAVTPGAVAYGGATNFAFTTAGTAGQILQSNGAAAPTWTTLTSLPPNGTAGGDLTGSYPNPTILASAITSAKIADGTIVNADIANVDASKITTGTLPLTVGGTGATSAAGARTSLGLGTLATLSAVSNAEITDGTIGTLDLANTSVTDAKIASGITPSKVTASGTPGQVLTTVGTTTTWANLPAFGTGSVTSITAGTGLSGGTITTSGTIALNNTGVTATTYGSATAIPVITVDLQGRITSATTAAPTAPGLTAVLTSSNNAGGTKITNLGAPTVNTDATTKLYVDNLDAADLDKSITNEIQTISKAGTTVTLSGGGGTFTDADVQNLSVTPAGTNRTVNITNGTGVTFSVADNDNDSGNEIQGLASVLGTSPNAGGEIAVGFKALSIGTSSTPGALNVSGAHFMTGTPFPSGVEDYNVKDDDYIIFGAPTISKPGNIYLPKASGSRGRVIIVRATGNEGSTSLRIHADDGIDGAAATVLMMSNPGNIYAMTVYSTGATWISLSKSEY